MPFKRLKEESSDEEYIPPPPRRPPNKRGLAASIAPSPAVDSKLVPGRCTPERASTPHVEDEIIESLLGLSRSEPLATSAGLRGPHSMEPVASSLSPVSNVTNETRSPYKLRTRKLAARLENTPSRREPALIELAEAAAAAKKTQETKSKERSEQRAPNATHG
ncbi:hypothetical protein B0H12DRAFT_1230057 [Mycena haematopus]|nr:hypothetical protein B0H12DRAFT_1230057 [Mycena haematopus]